MNCSNPSNESSTPFLTITSTTPDGTYIGDDSINISITFGDSVTLINDSLVITLQTGGIDNLIKIGMFEMTKKINGTYTVQHCDYSEDLRVISLKLQGTGKLLDRNSVEIVDLSIPSGNNLSDNSNIKLQTTIEITSNISDVTEWKGNNVYIIKKYDFYVNNTLTIHPGVVVKFHPDEGPYMMLSGSATIIARGTAEKPIIFTSFKDDTHWCDNNGDGSATQPAAKDWGEINTNSTNGSVFEYCEFYYGGNSTYNATLTLYGDNFKVKNCTFAHNDGSYTSGNHARTGVLNAEDAGSNTIIQNNVFYNNVMPLSISEKFNLDNTNRFYNPNNQSITNTYNSIWIHPEDDISSNIAWEETEVAFVVNEIGMTVATGGRLTLGNDVVIKFMSDAQLILDEGEQNIPNYNGTGVFFTSYKDDTRKGDTNGDGAVTTPANNDWIGIYDNRVPTSTPDPYYFQWTNIFYDKY
jgi:hypothetical protein